MNADGGSPAPTLAEQEALLTAYEKADRAYHVRLPAVVAIKPDAPVPPAPPAPPAPATPATPKAPKKPVSTTKPPATPKKPATSSSRPVTTVAPPSGAAGTVVSFALAQVGKPYVYATEGPSTYDCSGLVKAAYARVGIDLPHQSEEIAARGRPVPAGQWLPGDVIHMSGHVAIYIGNGQMVEAANPSAGIRVAPVRGGTAYRFL